MWNLESYNINFSSVTDFLSNRSGDISGLLGTINRDNIRYLGSMAAPYMTRDLMLGSVLGLSALYCFHNVLKSKSHEGNEIDVKSVKLLLHNAISSHVKEDDKNNIDSILDKFMQDNMHGLRNLRSQNAEAYSLAALAISYNLKNAFDGKLVEVPVNERRDDVYALQQEGGEERQGEIQQIEEEVVVEEAQQPQAGIQQIVAQVTEAIDGSIHKLLEDIKPGIESDPLITTLKKALENQAFKDALEPKEEKKEGLQHPYAFKALVMMPFAWKGFSTDANQIYDGFVNSAGIEKLLTFALPAATLCFAWNKDSRTATHLVTGYMLGVNCEFAAKAISGILHAIEWPFKKICGSGNDSVGVERK